MLQMDVKFFSILIQITAQIAVFPYWTKLLTKRFNCFDGKPKAKKTAQLILGGPENSKDGDGTAQLILNIIISDFWSTNYILW